MEKSWCEFSLREGHARKTLQGSRRDLSQATGQLGIQIFGDNTFVSYCTACRIKA